MLQLPMPDLVTTGRDLMKWRASIMGFRFRKSIKLLPGVRLNLSKSGVSTSIGRRGATLNFSERGTRGTVGLPGTGLSYSENLTSSGRRSSPGTMAALVVLVLLILAGLFLAVF